MRRERERKESPTLVVSGVGWAKVSSWRSMVWLREQLDAFISPSSAKNQVELFRGRLLVGSSFFIGVIASLTVMYRAWVFRLPLFVVGVSSFLAMSLLLTPFLVKRLGSHRAPGIFLSVVMLSVFPLIAYRAPVFPPPVLVFFPFVPVLVTFFVDARFGLYSVLIQTVVLAGLFWLGHAHGSVYRPSLTNAMFMFLCVATWVTYSLTWFYERSREWALSMYETTLGELRDADRAKDEFLARMSHELRTPLNAIIGYSEMMQEAEASELEEVRDDAGKICTAGEHLLSLIDDLLDITQLSAGRMRVEVVEVDPQELLAGVRAVVEVVAQKGGNRLDWEVGEELGSWVTDGKKLRRALVHILENACKFSKGGEVSFRVWREEEWICMDVADKGPGISDAQQAKIFEPFIQVDGSTTRAFDGAGLGLPIARHFARLLGGELELCSGPGEGTHVRLRFPQRLEVEQAQ